MNTKIHLILLVLGFLTYSLFVPSVAADNAIPTIEGKQIPFGSFQQKATEMCLADLPALVREKISLNMQKTEYKVSGHARPLPSGTKSIFRAFNRNQNLSAYFNERGVHFLPNGKGGTDWHLAMTLCGYGYGDAFESVSPVSADSIQASDNYIEYKRGKLTEWYVNDERGIEQGITIKEPPADKGSESLRVEWEVSGLLPQMVREGDAISFVSENRSPILRFSGIKAWDSAGRVLPAKLSVKRHRPATSIHRIAYIVDDTKAIYPIKIDPLFTQEKKLVRLEESWSGHFGSSVSMDGNIIVVGAEGWEETEGRNSCGAAFIFYRDYGGPDNWGQVKKITPSDGNPGDDFGCSVSISGDTVVVGTEAGAVYIFYRDHGGADNWGQVKKIIPSGVSGYFGSALCIDADTLMVGANGSVYIFERDHGGADNWGEFKKITASDGAEGDWFGISVALSRDTVVVGAYGDDDNGINSGAAYIFERDQGGVDNWGELKKIAASDGNAEDRFGWSVALSGDTVVVGAHWDDDNGTDSGSVYIFERDHGGADNWGEVRKIIPTDGAEGDCFGNSVSISLDTVAVGSYRDDDNGYNSGSVYIFERDNGGADTWGQVKKITPSDGAEWAQFGTSTFVSGNTIVVGLPHDSVKGYDMGSTFVFERNKGGTDNWGEQKWLFPIDVNYVAGDRFGRSVSTDSETIAVGAYLDDEAGSSAGAVYIFERDLLGPANWVQYIKKYFVYDTAAAGDYFGWSVSVDSGTLAVGAYRDDDNGSDSGAVYIYDRDNFGSDGWGYDRVKKLLPSDGAASDYFGYCVAISGDTVIVGSYQDDDNGTSSGAAYIFERDYGGADNWGQVKKIIPGDGAAYDYFGYCVAISGDTVIVGSYQDDDNGTSSGAAYIFERDYGGADNWGQVKKIIPGDGAAYDYFGSALCIDADTLLVGARGDDDNGSSSGSVYIFERNHGGADNWGELKKIAASDGAAGDNFGYAVSVHAELVAIGAYQDDDNGTNSGAAYIFERDHGGADNWGEVQKITASDGADNDYFGESVSISGDTLVIGASRDDDDGADSGSAYVVMCDVDTKDELAIDFKTTGIYVYNTGIWNRIYQGVDPEGLCSFGTYLAVDFGTTYGLYVYDAGAWTRVHKGVAIEKMAGFGGKLAVDFGTTYPIYEYNFSTDTWSPIYTYSSPRDTIEALGDKLVVDFKTAGIYVYDAGIWNRIYKGVDPVNIVSFGDKLAIDFGTAYGLYVYEYDTDNWTRIYKGVAIEKMAEIDENLAIDFGTAYGLYVYEFDTDNWTRVYKGVAIEKMAGFDGKLAVDFGTTYPIYEYDFATDNWNSIYQYSSPRDELVPANIFD